MTKQEKDTSATPVVKKKLMERFSGKKAKPAAEKGQSVKQPKKKPGIVFYSSIFIVLLVLLVAASGAWLWSQIDSQIAGLKQQQQLLASELESSTQKIAALEQVNTQSNQNWKQAVDKLEALVVSSAQRWNQTSDRNENRWPLEEALTLTRLAEQRLQLDASAKVAIGLLKSADKVLSGLDQASVLPLRRQIAADILALESTPAADVNGNYFILEAIADQVRDMNWVPKPTLNKALTTDTSPSEGFFSSLKQVVVVTRLDVPMQAPALQADFERWRQRFLLLLEESQLALLAHNQSLYDSALAQSLTTLAVMESQFSTVSLVEKLTQLQREELNPDWPEINQSVTAIEAYLSQQSSAQEASE